MTIRVPVFVSPAPPEACSGSEQCKSHIRYPSLYAGRSAQYPHLPIRGIGDALIISAYDIEKRVEEGTGRKKLSMRGRLKQKSR